jgi:16S rRNA (cytosine967-C5)-methyltransferase
LCADLESARKELEVSGVITESAPGGLPGLRWLGGPAPWSTPAWERGLIIVQDLAAQLAAPLLAPAPGETVIDLCAAPGGKTGHLWELMQGRGRLIACEIDPERRKPLRENLDRLYGSHGIEIPDFKNLDELLKLLRSNLCDKLLIDAPCQALGLIRRHPEIRWDQRLRAQDAMVVTQKSLLAAGARLVRRGGSLLWVTCSPTRAENEKLINAFLAENSEWDVGKISAPAELMPGLMANEFTWRTRPDIFPWDAFAFTMLRRKS